MPSLSIESQFGVIHCEYDEAATGVDASGRHTRGAVTRVWITSTGKTGSRVSSPVAKTIENAFSAWLKGDASALAALGVLQAGTPFQQSVWRAMRAIRPGLPVSYSVLAAMAGNAGAVRATASTCARNQIPLIVPCHRVINADGSIGRYSAGESGALLKQALLQHESVA